MYKQSHLFIAQQIVPNSVRPRAPGSQMGDTALVPDRWWGLRLPVVVAGVTQRMTRSAARVQANSTAHNSYPCWQPLPESQPVLPCLLRRLLQKGKAKEALSLATAHSQAPHFPRSLEWLLFTSLEINNNQMARPERSGVSAPFTNLSAGTLHACLLMGARIPPLSGLWLCCSYCEATVIMCPEQSCLCPWPPLAASRHMLVLNCFYKQPYLSQL